MAEGSGGVVLYDGDCGFCSYWVKWIIRHDPEGLIQFASLQGSAGRRLLGGATPSLGSVVLIDEEGVHERSEAARRILMRLPRTQLLSRVLAVIPRPLRDWGYGEVAKRRQLLSRGKEACLIPTAETRSRFLDFQESSEQA